MMKANDLIELLEYSPARARVSVAVVGRDGRVIRHDSPLFLAQDGRVYLVIDERPESGGGEGTPTEEIVLSECERPQLFGHRFVLLRKPDQAARRISEKLS
jgi:hypothetical protein